MRIVIAPDKFKESASAGEVARAIVAGLRRALPTAELIEIPLADGGEGTARVLTEATGGRMLTATVTGPLGEPVQAEYGLLGGADSDATNGATAVIEMAAASGLALVPRERRDPRRTTTRGTGELTRHALAQGARRLIIAIGGSATNDGGAGMAQALGFSLRDMAGRELPPGGAALARLDRIDGSRRLPELDVCEVLVACDVDNPLCGPRGASAVYGPQKGATPEMVRELDAALCRLGDVIRRDLGVNVLDLPGGGAAGGLGAGLAAFAGARLRPGFSLVAETLGLGERLAGADLVITGEGALDGQSVYGKTPVGVARLARERGIPVVVLAGRLGEGYESVYAEGVTAAFAIADGPLPLAEAMARTPELLAARAEAVGRLVAFFIDRGRYELSKPVGPDKN